MFPAACLKKICRIFVVVCFAIQAQAQLESTGVLPEGVRSPKFMYGTFLGLYDRFNSGGLIEGAADKYHIQLTGETLTRLDAKLKRLRSVLNKVNPSEKLGDKLNLGSLSFRADPSVFYFAPSFSYGLTKNISVGIGVPIIYFHNDVTVTSSGQNNVREMQKYVKSISADADQGFEDLVKISDNLPGELQEILKRKGYKPIRNIELTSPGDTQVSALYKYYESPTWNLAVRPYLVLPTGRKDDPDDLVDQALGGHSALGIFSIHEYTLNSKWTFGATVGYQAHLEDRVDVRVPLNADDVLPGPESREAVARKVGDSAFFEFGGRYSILRPLELSLYYDVSQKADDIFTGGQGKNYAILSADTSSQTHHILGRLEFSTLDWFISKMFSVPLLFGYMYSNTVQAVNAQKQIGHQIYLRMFF